MSQAVHDILSGEGVAFELASRCIAVEKRGAGIAVKADCAGTGREVVGSHLLLAVGRIPNTGDLGLDRAGVKTDARGFITVDDELHTGVPGYGRSAIATGAAHSPTPPTTTTRSSPTIC